MTILLPEGMSPETVKAIRDLFDPSDTVIPDALPVTREGEVDVVHVPLTLEPAIPWEYCECGCHGHEARIGSLYYWLYNDLKGTFHLNTAHRGSSNTEIGRYASIEAANVVVGEHVRGQLKEQRAALRAAEVIVAGGKLQTKIEYDPNKDGNHYVAFWRDPETGETACMFGRSRGEAESFLRQYPDGPQDALWLPTDFDL
jgi:hypothetical protein